MSAFPNSPRLLKGGLVLVDPESVQVRRIITLQYKPDTHSRSYQVQGGDGGAERAPPFRLKGPAIESIKLEADIDATDSLEHPDQNANAVRYGIAPQLVALESLVNPSTRELLAPNALAQSGTIEILSPEAHNYHVKGCNPFSSKPAAPPSQGAKKTSTTGGEE